MHKPKIVKLYNIACLIGFRDEKHLSWFVKSRTGMTVYQLHKQLREEKLLNSGQKIRQFSREIPVEY